ncbi:MAG: hypothetical protein Q7O66_16580 [Dehalococcoidia bacterium]|nr:hypothetical protein [Dehalococcoidia bacterium]
MRRVLGFDVANRTGYALIEETRTDTCAVVVEAGIIELTKGQKLEAQLDDLRAGVVLALRNRGQFDLAIYEEVPVRHGRGAELLGLQHKQYGALLVAFASMPFIHAVTSVSPDRWHMDMLGIMRNRPRLKAWAKAQAYIRTGYKTDDEDINDAVLIALWGLGALRLGLVKAAE